MNRADALKAELTRRFNERGWMFRLGEAEEVAAGLFGQRKMKPDDVQRVWREWTGRQIVAAFLAGRHDSSTILNNAYYSEAEELLERLAERGFQIVRIES